MGSCGKLSTHSNAKGWWGVSLQVKDGWLQEGLVIKQLGVSFLLTSTAPEFDWNPHLVSRGTSHPSPKWTQYTSCPNCQSCLTCIWLRLPAVMLEMVQQASLRMDSLLLLSKWRRQGKAEQLRTTCTRSSGKNYKVINFASMDFSTPIFSLGDGINTNLKLSTQGPQKWYSTLPNPKDGMKSCKKDLVAVATYHRMATCVGYVPVWFRSRSSLTLSVCWRMSCYRNLNIQCSSTLSNPSRVQSVPENYNSDMFD